MLFNIIDVKFYVPTNNSESIGCICPSEMSMLYIGVRNPLNVAISGIPANGIKVTIDGGGGTIEKVGNQYYANVKQTGNAEIVVSYYKSGPQEYRKKFRVRRIPKPEAKFGTIPNNGLPIPKVVLASQSRIYPSMGEGYDVTRYQFIY